MTEDIKRQIIQDTLNGETWLFNCKVNNCNKCKYPICPNGNWVPYTLGEGINENFEYKKVPKDNWLLFENPNYEDPNYRFELEDTTTGMYSIAKGFGFKRVLEGTRKECDDYIQKYIDSRKKWAEKVLDSFELPCRQAHFQMDMKELKKAFYLELEKHLISDDDNGEFIYKRSIDKIFNDLGI